MSASTPSSASTGHILKALAVGRLVPNPSDGLYQPGQHQVLCFVAHTDDSQVKSYKAHVKAIMDKGASKLVSGKRIRLTSDANDYDLHVLAESFLEDDESHKLVFFAVTSTEFAKHHTVGALLRDLKDTFYQVCDDSRLEMIVNSKRSLADSVNRDAQSPIGLVLAKYDKSELRNAAAKVDHVKLVMKENVEKALVNVEQLEEMESKSEQFEEHARQFSKNSSALRRLFQCRYYKVSALLFIIVAAIIAYIIFVIYDKVHSD